MIDLASFLVVAVVLAAVASLLARGRGGGREQLVAALVCFALALGSSAPASLEVAGAVEPRR